MKHRWRGICYLSLAIVLAACWQQKAKVNEDTDLLPSDTVSVVDLPETEPEVEEVTTPTRADELFDDFLWNFATDERLQLRRVKFPLPYSSPEDDASVDREEWEHDQLIADQPTYTLMFDKEEELDLDSDTSLESAEVEWVFLSTKLRQSYFFQRERGAWMLDSVSLAPLPETDDEGGFIDFYSRFANDSIYQLEHITNPIGFVTLDPDDEFSILETTMGISQWFAFRPELPKDRLTNINYGQANDDRSRTKILKVNGFQDGSSIILYFRKRNGEWEMYKFEDTSI